MEQNKGKRVLVAMSGGVDSSAAALLHFERLSPIPVYCAP